MKANLKNIQITDNFLPQRTYESFKESLCNHSDGPFWKWFPGQTMEGDGQGMFVALLYMDEFGPMLKKFEIVNMMLAPKLYKPSWWRIKLNCCFREPDNRFTGFHTDYGATKEDEFSEIGLNISEEVTRGGYGNMKTGIMYFSDTDGPTVFKAFPNFEVECKENRFVQFPSTYLHGNYAHTDGPARRLVLNMNWF